MTSLTLDMVLRAYAGGVFPMAEGRHDPTLYWVDPDQRGILPLDGFRISRRLAKTVRRDPFDISVDQDFRGVIELCAAAAPGRWTTWINDEIIELYEQMHRAGHAHSVEVRRDGDLVGGLYGVTLGAAFFGESMFSRATDASKVALVHLVARLKRCGFKLLDTQFVTDHLRNFGAVEVSREDYRERLAAAIAEPADFYCVEGSLSGAEALQSITQTS